jgi:hypothetical protein
VTVQCNFAASFGRPGFSGQSLGTPSQHEGGAARAMAAAKPTTIFTKLTARSAEPNFTTAVPHEKIEFLHDRSSYV